MGSPSLQWGPSGEVSLPVAGLRRETQRGQELCAEPSRDWHAGPLLASENSVLALGEDRVSWNKVAVGSPARGLLLSRKRHCRPALGVGSEDGRTDLSYEAQAGLAPLCEEEVGGGGSPGFPGGETPRGPISRL